MEWSLTRKIIQGGGTECDVVELVQNDWVCGSVRLDLIPGLAVLGCAGILSTRRCCPTFEVLTH